MTAALQVDHLVVAADSLEQGARWCEATFGLAPDAGGRHDWMGTHNRLLSLASASCPQAYLEIIAIDPEALAPARPRWFGLDDPPMRERLRESPRLVHWVLSCESIEHRRDQLRQAGFDPGDVCDAQRDTAEGLLKWRITVRPDGRLLCDGAMPTLIEWPPGRHPSRQLPDRGLRLDGLTVGGAAQRGDWAPWPVPGVTWAPGPGPALRAAIDTPSGPVTLVSG